MRTWARLREYVATTRPGEDIVPLDPAEVSALLDAVEAAQRFLGAYDDASVSDGEGLLMAVDPAAMRALWDRVDEAADELRTVLAPERTKQAEALADSIDENEPLGLAQAFKTIVAELRALRAQRVRMLGLDTSHPLVDVLRKMREATDILLDEKNYDGHGWEQLQAARDAASGYISVASSPPEKQP